MCWSAEVSLGFACFDMVIIALLLLAKVRDETSSNTRHKKPRKQQYAGTYAAIMTSVALQEWAQYWIWKRGTLTAAAAAGEDGAEPKTTSNCTEPIDIWLGFMTTGAAESLPLMLIGSSYLTSLTRHKIKQHHQYYYCDMMRHRAIICWVIQCCTVFAASLMSHKYCVELGPNHHQIWICESATYQVGGHAMHDLFYGLYIVSCLYGVESLHEMPLMDKRQIQWLGIIISLTPLVLWGETLEACSIWCWSAFALGVFLCIKVYCFGPNNDVQRSNWLEVRSSTKQVLVYLIKRTCRDKNNAEAGPKIL